MNDRSFSERLDMLTQPEIFKIGDRVMDRVLALKKGQIERLRRGTVTDVTSERLTNINMITYRYSVRWDDTGQVEHGYMSGGNLRRELEG
jgi:hypothetical protein